MKSISRGEQLIIPCEYCIVQDDEPVFLLDVCNEMNKANRDKCNKKWDEVGVYQ